MKTYNIFPPENFEKMLLKHHCPYCSYSTNFKSFLKRHMCKHTGERPFACPYCTKRFSRKHTLQCHITIVHSN